MPSVDSPKAIPRTIWMIWLQGWSQAPRMLQACRRTWELRNPGWTVRCLDAADIPALIDDAELCAALQRTDSDPVTLSDRIKIAVLERHGGVWADATTYCLQPLEEWLFEVADSGFFAFNRPGADRLISSWFLAAEPDHPTTRRWAELTRDYWRGRAERHHYYWFHYLFGAECEANPAFRARYEAMTKISADGPHAYYPYDVFFWVDLQEEDVRLVEGAAVPLFKLSHRTPPGGYPDKSVAAYLCRRVGF